MSIDPAMPFDPQQVENAGAPKPPAAALGGTRIRYWHTYAFIFENPKWATNVFYGFLCVLSSQVIPVVGVLLFIGYIFDVAESLHRHPDRTYPDFTLGREKINQAVRHARIACSSALNLAQSLSVLIDALAAAGEYAEAIRTIDRLNTVSAAIDRPSWENRKAQFQASLNFQSCGNANETSSAVWA